MSDVQDVCAETVVVDVRAVVWAFRGAASTTQRLL